MLLLLIIAVLSAFLPASFQENQGCTIQLPFTFFNDSIYFTQNYEFLYPKNESIIYLNHEDQVIIACLNGTLTYEVDDQLLNGNSSVVATCNDSAIELDGMEVMFDEFLCPLERMESSRPSTTVTCPGQFIGLDVGFAVNDIFVPQYSVCFDEPNQIPFYAQYDTSNIVMYVPWILISSTIVVDEQYTTIDNYSESFEYINQQSTINQQLGLEPDSEKYIDVSSYHYYSANPLVQGYFFYQAKQQIAAFRSVNAVPVWALADNWMFANGAHLSLVEAEINLIGYTGVHGQLTLPHKETGEEIPLFLYLEDDVTALPIPAVLWTLIYDPITQRAAAYVSVNNGYRLNEEEEVLCEDVTDELGWLVWYDRENITYGYSYACAYEDLKSKITYLPDLTVSGLLTNSSNALN